MESTDAELVRAACRGDVDSFRRLYERYYRLVLGIARSRVSDQHLAEDAAQEAFAVACRKLASLRDANRFPEWLGTICRRTAGKLARSHANGKPARSAPDSLALSKNEAGATVREALEQLPEAAREVLNLHYFSGLSYEEIAHSLGVSPQAVHGRMQRARRMLARELKDK